MMNLPHPRTTRTKGRDACIPILMACPSSLFALHSNQTIAPKQSRDLSADIHSSTVTLSASLTPAAHSCPTYLSTA